MPDSFTDKEWAEILRIARMALELPSADRATFVGQQLSDPRVAEETLKVAQELEYPAADEPSRLSTMVGRFELLDYLGSGAFGQVYSARDPDLLRTVAIKILRPDTCAILELEERFIREARAISALNHPNIVTIHEVLRTEGTLAIVMELISGQTLRHKIAGPIPTERLIDIGGQMAEGLSAAHAAGITHRDIKPENVMVSPEGRVKLLDFGLAKSSGVVEVDGQGSLRSSLAGTPRYMSPEHFRHESLTAKSDIFAMGLVLYEAATGTYPFPPGDALEVLHSIASMEVQAPSSLNPKIPLALNTVILAMLRKNAGERPAADNVCHALKHIRSQQSAFTIASANGGIRKQPNSARRGWLWVGLSSCAAAVALFAAWSMLPSNRPRELRLLPLDGNAGIETGPAFSPDSKQIAYSWDGNRRNLDIYVKPIAGGSPHRLTDNAGHDIDPSWSPDGRQIAFLRVSPQETNVVIVPSSGGIEKVLHDSGTSVPWEPEGAEDNAAAGPAWSRDGKYLVVPRTREPGGLQKLSLDGHRESLTHAPSGMYDSCVSMSPSGRYLAFRRVSGAGSSDLYIVPTRGGNPARLTFAGRDIQGIAWLDDNTILYSSNQAGSYCLWQVRRSGGSPRLFPVGGSQPQRPALSRDGRWLAFVEPTSNATIWRAILPYAPDKKFLSEPFLSSARRDYSPEYSFNGKKIAFVSDRTGETQIWVAESDGSGVRQLTDFQGSGLGSPHWSPNDRRIVFDGVTAGLSAIWLVNADGSFPHRLNSSRTREYMPTWSRDGHWIYYSALKEGQDRLLKQNSETGEVIRVSDMTLFDAREGADGHTLYAQALDGQLWQLPSAGGAPALVPGLEGINVSRYWTVAGKEIYLTRAENRSYVLRRYDTVTKTLETLGPISSEVLAGTPGLSADPTQRYLLFVQRDQNRSSIMLQER